MSRKPRKRRTPPSRKLNRLPIQDQFEEKYVPTETREIELTEIPGFTVLKPLPVTVITRGEEVSFYAQELLCVGRASTEIEALAALFQDIMNCHKQLLRVHDQRLRLGDSKGSAKWLNIHLEYLRLNTEEGSAEDAGS